MTFLSRVRDWISRLFARNLWLVENCDDLPEKPRPRRVYLVGERRSPWSAAFICPCGCGELVQLSLIRDDDPSWIASGGDGGRASLHPSIWRIRGCRSHFFIKQGKVVWAKEARPDHRIEF